MYRLRIFQSSKATYLLVVSYCVLSQPISENEDSLQLVHVLFRHGERTNIRFGIYPKDPYINETYEPYGRGQLTNRGKKREYELGKTLRERYDEFLGEGYRPEAVDAWSSDTNRTKLSLLLLLAGLFPPTTEQIFEDGLPWQPIPFNQVPQNKDKIFFGVINCPKYKVAYQSHIQSQEMVEKFEEYRKLFDLLSEETGWNVTSFQYVFRIYIGLVVEEEWGLELPSWTQQVYPQPVKDLAIQEYLVSTATTEMRRIISGYLLKKIVDDTKSKLNNEGPSGKRKIYLYSGHEFNLAALLATLDVFDPPHIPPYGSYIIFEVHKIGGANKIKILYENYATHSGPQVLTLPGCESLCDFENFVQLIEKYLPNNVACGNDSECSENTV